MIGAEQQDAFEFDPADCSTWHLKPPPILGESSVFPKAQRRCSQDWFRAPSESDEDIGLFRTPSIPSSTNIAPDSEAFRKLLEDSLRIDHGIEARCNAKAGLRVRSISSDYPSRGFNSPQVESPTSTIRINRLSFSNLSRFGHTNDRLSNLKSSPPTSPSQDMKAVTSGIKTHGATTAAISEWQARSQPRPRINSSYNQYELPDSSDIGPSDSLSRKGLFSTETPTSAFTDPDDATDGRGQPWSSGIAFGNQCDGPADAHDDSPAVMSESGPVMGSSDATPSAALQSKRKASQFSLRSLGRSLSKRHQISGVRKWASTVCHGGTRRINEAYRRLRLKNERELHQFEA
ncbi:hypothetical protein RJ55_08015 [Drechmeria coniospora]|nr:hypothetical protein RJ55_08015 [Drechmeria coniospora]